MFASAAETVTLQNDVLVYELDAWHALALSPRQTQIFTKVFVPETQGDRRTRQDTKSSFPRHKGTDVRVKKDAKEEAVG